ncbi:Methyltransferase-like protein 22 [Halocaridina rubra]|uniref:Methyltransferase-like protein 22 n=1 Tax=Halocaridina rubra TaxID=373956 RepID=A0AAN9AGX1_HALRR
MSAASAVEVDEDENENEKKDLAKYYKVSSEVMGFTKGKSVDGASAVLSRFDFLYPTSKTLDIKDENLKVTLDEDGDSLVVRKNQLNKKEDVLLIEHQNATTLNLVGEQVWAAALFLADFILQNHSIFKGAHVLELASGVGLTSIVAAMFAAKVTITDIDVGEILELIRRNVDRNSHLLRGEVDVKVLDFFEQTTIESVCNSMDNVTVLLAADVIYNNPLTDCFMNTVLRLMSEPPNKTLYLAMEKRYVFTLEDMDAVAPCYEYLLDRLEWLRCQNLSRVEWSIEMLASPCDQYFTYERSKHLVMWRITSRLKTL